MKYSPPQHRSSTTRVIVLALGLMLAQPFISGCGDEEIEGVEARLKVDFGASSRVDEPPVDTWTDVFPTPTAVKVGIKSIKLINSIESTTYTIVDKTDPTALIKLEFLSPSTDFQVVDMNRVFPSGCPCNFDKAEVEFIFFDQKILTEGGTPWWFRFYTLDYSDPDLAKPVKTAEVLVGNATGLPNYSWVTLTNGDRVPLTGTGTIPASTLTVPKAMFPNDIYSSLVKVDINPVIEIPSKPGGIYTLTLTLKAQELFFYDEVDGPNNPKFNFNTDGKLNGNDPDSHYYPLYPKITAATP